MVPIAVLELVTGTLIGCKAWIHRQADLAHRQRAGIQACRIDGHGSRSR